MGGPSKTSLIEDSRCLKFAIGLFGPGPVLTLNEVVSTKDGLMSLKKSWQAIQEEINKAFGMDDLVSSLGLSQPLLVDNAQIGVTHSLIKSGPSNLRNLDSEFINFWVKEVLRKQLEEDQQTEEKLKTDHVLIEKALRYGNAFDS